MGPSWAVAEPVCERRLKAPQAQQEIRIKARSGLRILTKPMRKLFPKHRLAGVNLNCSLGQSHNEGPS